MRRSGKALLLGVVAVAATLAASLFAFRQESPKAGALKSDCDPNRCPPTRCTAGFHSELGPDGCCLRCVESPRHEGRADPCAHERCSACPEGTQPQEAEGQCCPRCVSTDPEACERGRARYDLRRAELEAELRGCVESNDCMVASFADACQANCSMPLNKLRLGTVVANLREEAAVYCDKCAPESFACPDFDPRPPTCVRGRCEFGAQ